LRGRGAECREADAGGLEAPSTFRGGTERWMKRGATGRGGFVLFVSLWANWELMGRGGVGIFNAKTRRGKGLGEGRRREAT